MALTKLSSKLCFKFSDNTATWRARESKTKTKLLRGWRPKEAKLTVRAGHHATVKIYNQGSDVRIQRPNKQLRGIQIHNILVDIKGRSVTNRDIYS